MIYSTIMVQIVKIRVFGKVKNTLVDRLYPGDSQRTTEYPRKKNEKKCT
jgi:hypothetical protein